MQGKNFINKFNIYIISLFLFGILFMNVSVCKGEDKRMLKGKLYLGGGIFGKVDLETKKWTPFYKGKSLIYGQFPNIVNNNLFIIQSGGIQFYDVRDNEFKFIAEGEKPLYVKEISSVFYYKYKKGLFQKKLSNDTQEEFITDNLNTIIFSFQPNILHYPDPPIKISATEIAYYNKDKRIEIYNFITKSFRVLDIIDYEPWTFYTKKNSLICRNEKDNNFYFVNTLTLEKERILIDNVNLTSIIPVDNYNCLIYSKVRLVFIAEYTDMYIYWVDEKREERYLKNFDIISGVYVED